MSTGDIDDRLAPEGDLQEIIEGNQQLKEYLKTAYSLLPIRSFFIPFGAGMSFDGTRVYISMDINTMLDGIDISPVLIRHETTEWGLREFAEIGEDYARDPTGHRLANRAEFELITHLLGEDGWERYVDFIDPQVIKDERESFDDKPVPADLALYPYDDVQKENIQSAQFNAASRRAWRALANG
jgi:hypothetical protein